MPQRSISPGENLEAQLREALRDFTRAPLQGARGLPFLDGVTPKGLYTQPLENVHIAAIDILAHNDRVYRLGDQVVFERHLAGEVDRTLHVLTGPGQSIPRR